MRSRWTLDEVRLLRHCYAETPLKTLAKALGKTPSACKQKARSLGLTVRPGLAVQRRVEGRPRRWTPAMDRQLEAHYRREDLDRHGIAEALGVSFSSVKNRAQELGLKRPVTAHNRWGKHNPPPRPPKGYGVSTRFRPGRAAHESHNYRPIGSTGIRDGYLVVKVTDNAELYPAKRWQAVHRLVWEAAHGPIPEGHVVCFLPGRATTVEAEITLDRLECISRTELALRNSIHNYPPELADLIRLRGRLVRAIKKRAGK